MQARSAPPTAGSSLYKANIGRERAKRVAEAVSQPELEKLAESDVYWDRIVSIEPDGTEEVFDLTVDGLHNFVADDIVVHNSIEQDADIVSFIYRDEYYNNESERRGEADLMIAKHRNGPIGTVPLAFQSQFPKFVNLARSTATSRTRSRGRLSDGEEVPRARTAGRPARGAAREPSAGGIRWRRCCPTAGAVGVPTGDARSRLGRAARWASATAPGGSSAPTRRAALRVPAAADRAGPLERAEGVAAEALPRRLLRSSTRLRHGPPAGPQRDRRRRAPLLRDDRRAAGRRARALADGRSRNRQDDAGDAGLEGGDRRRRGPSRSTRPRHCSPGSARPSTPRRRGRLLAFFDRLVSVDLLHLDDLGAERSTDWVLEQLYAIVDRRYNDERSIVFTTNLEEPELTEQVGTRTVSRLVEMCDGNPLPLFGEDRRVEMAPGAGPPQPS